MQILPKNKNKDPHEATNTTCKVLLPSKRRNMRRIRVRSRAKRRDVDTRTENYSPDTTTVYRIRAPRVKGKFRKSAVRLDWVVWIVWIRLDWIARLDLD
jgi:hypothetical protein